MSGAVDRSALPRVAARFTVAFVLLALVVRSVLPAAGEEGVVAALAGAWKTTPGDAAFWLAIAFAILGVSFAIGALRFQGLMQAGGLEARFATVFRAYVVAGFFNLVLPSAMLGDVYRFADARSDAGRGAEVLGVLVLERLLGLSALGAIGLLAAPFLPTTEAAPGVVPAIVALCASFALVTVAVVHPRVSRVLRVAVTPFERIAPRLAAASLQALEAVSAFAARPRAVAFGLLLSLLNQGLPVLAILALAEPLAVDVAWGWYAVIVPFVTLASLLPISIGGTGVREALYVLLFGAVGMPAPSALALSLSVLAVALVWAVVGLIVFLVGRSRDGELAPRTGSA